MVVSPNDGSNENLDGIEREALEKFAEPFGQSQCQSVLRAWFPVLRKLAGEKSPDNEWEYERTVGDATQILRDLKCALSAHVKRSDSPFIRDNEEKAKREKREKERNGTLWYVPDRWSIRYRPDHWDQASPVDRGQLVDALGMYLTRPELQNDRIDWACTNALLFDELARTTDSIKSGVAFGEINWAYTLGGPEEEKMLWATLGLGVLKLSLRWFLPAAIVAGLAYFQWFTGAAIVGATWALYLTYRLLTYPARRKLGRAKEKQLAKYGDMMERMATAWIFANSGVIHPSRLRELVLSAEGTGAIYLPVLHSLLDRAIQRNPSFLSPFNKP